MTEENERYGELNGMRAFSLADLAEKIGVSKGYISRRVGEEKDVRGYPVFEWAVRDGAGRVDHYRVPKDAFEEQSDDDPDDARENTTTTDTDPDGETVTAKARVQSIRDVAREARERRENAEAERHREQLEADRKRRERAEQRRNQRQEERDAQSNPNAHTYTVAEMTRILDADEADVREAVANGRDVRGFPVSEFAVIGDDGNLERFRVPHSAFEDATAPQDAESSRETGDPGTTQPKSAAKRRSGLGGLLALGAATAASVAMGAFDNE